MSTMLEKVNYISTIKSNIGKAITDKGGTVTEDFDSYATAITNLPSGGGSPASVDFESIGYDGTESCFDKMETDIAYSEEVKGKYERGEIYTFQSDTKLVYCPAIDTSSMTDMSKMFYNCDSLSTIPLLDTSSVTGMHSVFEGCQSLITIPLLNTSSVTDMSYMFWKCSSLNTIPQLDTSSVTDMHSVFEGCQSLITIPLLNTSSVTDMSYMFQSCSSLTAIPQLDTSSVTDMQCMFNGCHKLTAIPQLDTSKVTNMSYMLPYCYELTAIPQLDTSKATNMNYMFAGCQSLITIPLLDCSSVTSMNYIFGYDPLSKLTDLGGFKNLGKAGAVNGTDSKFIDKLPNATAESLMNIINNLWDIKSEGRAQELSMGSGNLAKLTPEQIQIATDKGWTLK